MQVIAVSSVDVLCDTAGHEARVTKPNRGIADTSRLIEARPACAGLITVRRLATLSESIFSLDPPGDYFRLRHMLPKPQPRLQRNA